MSVGDRRARFRELHAGTDLFLMPNPWDVGSARLLAAWGALAATNSRDHRDHEPSPCYRSHRKLSVS